MESSTSTRAAVVQQEPAIGPVCKHTWVIDKPNGPSSRGVCRLCGEERQFQNYIEGSSWGYDVSVEQPSGGSRYPAGVVVQKDASVDEEG